MSLTRPSTLWRYTARTLRRRPGRTLLTLLGIAIGVATAVAVSLTVEAARQGCRVAGCCFLLRERTCVDVTESRYRLFPSAPL